MFLMPWPLIHQSVSRILDKCHKDFNKYSFKYDRHLKAREIKLNTEIKYKLSFLFNATKKHLHSPVH